MQCMERGATAVQSFAQHYQPASCIRTQGSELQYSKFLKTKNKDFDYWQNLQWSIQQILPGCRALLFSCAPICAPHKAPPHPLHPHSCPHTLHQLPYVCLPVSAFCSQVGQTDAARMQLRSRLCFHSVDRHNASPMEAAGTAWDDWHLSSPSIRATRNQQHGLSQALLLLTIAGFYLTTHTKHNEGLRVHRCGSPGPGM